MKVLKGSIKINGSLNATGTTFTSLNDPVLPSACPSVLSPSPCTLASTDWGGINVDAQPSQFKGGSIENASSGLTISGAGLTVTGPATVAHVLGDAFTVKNAGTDATDPNQLSTFSDITIDDVTGNGINLMGSVATLSRDVIKNIHGAGHYAVISSGANTKMDCMGIHDDVNGISFDGTSSITESNVLSNSASDVTGTGGAPTATAVWWGGTPGTASSPAHPTATVTVTDSLASEQPVLTDPPTPGGKIEITGNNPTASDDPNGTRALGIGTMTDKLTFSRVINPTSPLLVTFDDGTNGAAVHDVTAVAGFTLVKRVWTSGAYQLNYGTATAGLNHLRVSGATSCVPDENNQMVPATKDFYAAVRVTVLAPDTATGTYGGTAPLSATLSWLGAGLGNEAVSFQAVRSLVQFLQSQLRVLVELLIRQVPQDITLRFGANRETYNKRQRGRQPETPVPEERLKIARRFNVGGGKTHRVPKGRLGLGIASALSRPFGT